MSECAICTHAAQKLSSISLSLQAESSCSAGREETIIIAFATARLLCAHGNMINYPSCVINGPQIVPGNSRNSLLKWAALSPSMLYYYMIPLFFGPWRVHLSRGRARNSLAAVCIIIPAGGHKSRHHLSYYVPMIQISAQMLSADTLSLCMARGRKNMFVPSRRRRIIIFH